MFNFEAWKKKKSGPQTPKGIKLRAKYGAQNSTAPSWTMGNSQGQHPAGNGYMPGYVTPVNWFVHTPDQIIDYTPLIAIAEPTPEQMMNDFLNGIITPYTPGFIQPYATAKLPQVGGINGTGPTETTWHLAPYEASQLYVQDAGLGQLLADIIFRGINPYSAEVQHREGTPGTMKAFSDPSDPGFEYHFGASFNFDGSLDRPGFYQGEAPSTGIPAQFLQQKPKKRKKKKAWFLNPTGQ